jgi:hypothetical protein
MVLEHESLHLPQKSTSFVGKYTSTMEHLGSEAQIKKVIFQS